MKKINLTIVLAGLSCITYAQQPATGSASGPVPASFFNTTKAWFRGGNTATGSGFTDNIFGTAFNSPVYHITGGQQRMTLFGNVGTNSGSGNGALAINLFPFSPITQPNSLFNIGEGLFPSAQPWMQVGMSVYSDNDGAYFGLIDEGLDRKDAIIAFGNDIAGGAGPMFYVSITRASTPKLQDLHPMVAMVLVIFEPLVLIRNQCVGLNYLT